MDRFDEIKKFLNTNDRFARENGIQLITVRTGYAEAELVASDRHLNGLNIIQGGATYTLCDLAFAGAANTYGVQAVGMTGTLSFVRPGTGSKLRAQAKEVSKGKRTVLFDLNVYDEKDRLVAHGTMNGFLSDIPFFAENS